jgi:hypothetical protein
MEEQSEREKDQFYERLDRTYQQCPSHDIIIISGDMNAKVGKNFWTGIGIGTCRLHDERNDNGTHIIYEGCSKRGRTF